MEEKKVYVLCARGRVWDDIIAVYQDQYMAQDAKRNINKDLSGAQRDELFIIETSFY